MQGILITVQDANPAPPIVQVPDIHAGVHWHAFLSGRVVRDVLVDRPNAHINLEQNRDEAAGAVPAQELGRQEALQAVMPLRANELSSSMVRLPISTNRRRGRCAPADRFVELYSQRRTHNMPLKRRRWSRASRPVYGFWAEAAVGAAPIVRWSGFLGT